MPVSASQPPLDDSAKLLLQRDSELTKLNLRYEKQLTQLRVLQEAILFANQIKDRQTMMKSVGELLIHRLSYDRFFVIEATDKGFLPVAGIGFDQPSFTTIVAELSQTDYRQLIVPIKSADLFVDQETAAGPSLTKLMNVRSLIISPLTNRHFRGYLGIGLEQPLESFIAQDLEFINLLVGQLNVILENIASLAAMEAKNSQLNQLDKTKTTFLSITSHQLRTPLSVIKFALTVLNSPETGPLNKEQQDLVREMVKSNNRIIGLVNNLLNIARLEQGRLVVRPEPLELNQLVQTILEEIKERITTKGIQVQVVMPKKIHFIGDHTLIYETLMNLLTNGVKYNKDKGKLIITGKQSANQVIITVQDTGIGIPAEDQARLFTQFYRSQEASSLDPEGVGLGLYTTRQFVRLHGGDIAVSSMEGVGTAFTVVLPIGGPPVNGAQAVTSS